MLNRVDLYSYFGSSHNLLSEPAVKIQGAMMKAISAEYAAKLHISGYHPYSVFVFPYGSGFVIRVSTLNDEAEEILKGMCSLAEIKLYGAHEPMIITDRKPYDPVTADELGNELSAEGCRIEFITPAMIKTGGKPTSRPDIPAYFYSVIQRYNEFEEEEIAYSDFLDAWNNSELAGYELKSEKYNVSGHIFPGMTGFCDIVFPKNKKQKQLLRHMISYAAYCGVGGKTGMGMGGVFVQDL
ncbi:MAG: CRISPR system precrRNA processing endoribonuclease RAMP protein Cas6 [Oscillospiraceae bacterium]|nr:CRISPR system precrRNA processing endoribonuclease RAMP protein Cas6 [Oscillospiraceae bacterium]